MPRDETAIREELLKACKVLYKCGIVDVIGHLSTRLDDERILIKPRPVSWFNLTTDDLIVLDFNGKRIDGPASERTEVREWPIHTEVYKARPDVRSVLHCHPVDSTLMASLDIEIEPLTRELLYFVDGVPVYDSLQCLLYHRGQIDTAELGAEVAQVLGTCNAALLKHHGNVVIGRTIGETCLGAYYLERGAQIMLKAAAVRELPIMSADRKAAMAAAWRRLPRVSPNTVAERWAMLQEDFLHRPSPVLGTRM